MEFRAGHCEPRGRRAWPAGPFWPPRAHSVCFSGTWVSRACASPVWGSVSMGALGPGPPRKQGLWGGWAGRKGVTPSRVGWGVPRSGRGTAIQPFSSFLRCGLHSQTTPFLRLHGAHSIRPRHTHCPARPRPQTSPRALRLVLQLAACSGHSLPPLFRGPKTGRREGQGPTHARDMLTVEQSAVTAGGCPLGPAGGGERPASCAGALTRACVSPSRNMGDLRRPDHRRGKTRLLRSRRPREGGPCGAHGTHQ